MSLGLKYPTHFDVRSLVRFHPALSARCVPHFKLNGRIRFSSKIRAEDGFDLEVPAVEFEILAQVKVLAAGAQVQREGQGDLGRGTNSEVRNHR